MLVLLVCLDRSNTSRHSITFSLPTPILKTLLRRPQQWTQESIESLGAGGGDGALQEAQLAQREAERPLLGKEDRAEQESGGDLCPFVLQVLMLRRCLTWLRATWLAQVLPLDQNIQFHQLMGYVVVGLSLVHTVAHVVNFGECPGAGGMVGPEPFTTTQLSSPCVSCLPNEWRSGAPDKPALWTKVPTLMGIWWGEMGTAEEGGVGRAFLVFVSSAPGPV